MLPPIQKLPRTALPVFSATLLLALSGTPSTAAEPVIASTAPYHASLALRCSSGAHFCRGELPAVLSRRRVKLTRVSCVLRGAEYSAYANGKLETRRANTDGSFSLLQFLPADYSTQWGYHVLNAAVDAYINPGHLLSVTLSLAPGSGTAYDASCTAHGTTEFFAQ
jgi:hypothetical protein